MRPFLRFLGRIFGYLGDLVRTSRAKTAGFAMASTCVIGIIVGVAVAYMLSPDAANWGLKAACFFVCLGDAFVGGSWFVLPDTSRRSPAELDELVEARVRPWRFHKTETLIEKAGISEDQGALSETRQAVGRYRGWLTAPGAAQISCMFIEDPSSPAKNSSCRHRFDIRVPP